MKTVINSKLTRAGIKFVAGIVAKRSNLPILSNVHIYANGCFAVTGTDLDVTLSARLPGATAVEGKTTLPARALMDAVAGGNDIELETNDKHVTTIKSGVGVRSVCGLSNDEFPAETVMPESAAHVTVPADLFIACLKQVEGAMSTDESRYVLNGVCLELSAEEIKFIATDGRRLQIASLATGGTPLTAEQKAAVEAAQKTLESITSATATAKTRFDEELAKNPPTYTPVEVESFGTLYRKEDHSTVKQWQSVLDENNAMLIAAQAELAKLGASRQVLIPTCAVKHILRLPLDKKAPGVLTLSDWTMPGKDSTPQARIDCGDYSITTKQIEGNYPNYKQVIPNETKIAVRVNIAALRECLKVAEKATDEKSNSVKLSVANNSMSVTGKSPEVGEATASLMAQSDSDPAVEFVIAFNPRYLIDACDMFAVAGLEMTLNFIDELSPVKITNESATVGVIMPIRLN